MRAVLEPTQFCPICGAYSGGVAHECDPRVLARIDAADRARTVEDVPFGGWSPRHRRLVEGLAMRDRE